jgi:di/tricarboxylate transporter
MLLINKDNDTFLNWFIYIQMTVLKLLLTASLILISSCEVAEINNNKPDQSKMIKQN